MDVSELLLEAEPLTDAEDSLPRFVKNYIFRVSTHSQKGLFSLFLLVSIRFWPVVMRKKLQRKLCVS